MIQFYCQTIRLFIPIWTVLAFGCGPALHSIPVVESTKSIQSKVNWHYTVPTHHVFEAHFDADGAPYPLAYLSGKHSDLFIREKISPLDCQGDIKNARVNIAESLDRPKQYDANRETATLAAHIRRALLPDDNSPATLVIQIHGINNTRADARAQFAAVRDRILQYAPHRRFVFLAVFWDGLNKWPESDVGTYWFKAVVNSKRAGAWGLRKLLEKVVEGAPGLTIRAISHSRGAAVLLGAFFGAVIKPEHQETTRCRFHRTNANPSFANSSISLPENSNVKIAMIAPAIGAVSITQIEAKNFKRKWLRRFIVGFNQNDPVLQKKIKIAKYFSTTTLGVDHDMYSRAVEHINSPGIHPNGMPVAMMVRFDKTIWQLDQEAHPMTRYLENPKFEACTLKALFTDDLLAAECAQ